MKNITGINSCFWLLLSISVFACEPIEDREELPAPLTASQVDFTVRQVEGYDNKVIVENKTPAVIPYWESEAGTSHANYDTLSFPFGGEYTIYYSAYSGGVPFRDSVKVTVSENDPNYFADPLWDLLTNGEDGKTWVLDMDAEYFVRPMYFYGTDNGWLAGGDSGCYGDDCWNWSPVYADNTWLFPDGDYGTMTFSLNGGFYFHAVKPMEGGIEQTGTFALDIQNKILTINNGSILRGYKGNNAGIAGISDWRHYNIFSLTENTMQLGVIRDKDIDGEGSAQLVYNFIAK